MFTYRELTTLKSALHEYTELLECTDCDESLHTLTCSRVLKKIDHLMLVCVNGTSDCLDDYEEDQWGNAYGSPMYGVKPYDES